MASLTTIEKQILESSFQMRSGYVLNFSDRTMEEFFRDDLKIDIYNKKYNLGSGSKANRLRGFWLKADDKTVGESILKLIEYIENQIILGKLQPFDFPVERINVARKIANTLIYKKIEKVNNLEATFKNGDITITLQKDVFKHVEDLLNNKHYFNAVEESYKIVRQKLKNVSGKEKATDAFSSVNFDNIFGHQPKDEAEKDFFEGVKFLHMSIQFLRNDKSHTPAQDMDKNLAIHYISLASLAYDLIDNN